MAAKRGTILSVIDFIFRGEGLEQANKSTQDFNRVTEETERKIENVIERHRQLALAAKQAAKASTEQSRSAQKSYEREETALQRVIRERDKEIPIIDKQKRSSEQRINTIGQELLAIRALQDEQRSLRKRESERRVAVSKDVKASQEKVKSLEKEVKMEESAHKRSIRQRESSIRQQQKVRTTGHLFAEQPAIQPKIKWLSRTLGLSTDDLVGQLFKGDLPVEKIGKRLDTYLQSNVKKLAVPDSHGKAMQDNMSRISEELNFMYRHWDKHYDSLSSTQRMGESAVRGKMKGIKEPDSLLKSRKELTDEKSRLSQLESSMDEIVGGHEPARLRAVGLREQSIKSSNLLHRAQREFNEWGTGSERQVYNSFIDARNKSVTSQRRQEDSLHKLNEAEVSGNERDINRLTKLHGRYANESESEFTRAKDLYKSLSPEGQRRVASQEIIDKISKDPNVDTGALLPRKQYGSGLFTTNEHRQIQGVIDQYKEVHTLQDTYRDKNRDATEAEKRFNNLQKERKLLSSQETEQNSAIRRLESDIKKSENELNQSDARLQYHKNKEFLARDKTDAAEKASNEATEAERKSKSALRSANSEFAEVKRHGEQGLSDISKYKAHAEYVRSGGGDIGDISAATGGKGRSGGMGGGGRRKPPKGGAMGDIDDYLENIGIGGGGEESIGRKITGSYAAMYISRRVFLLHTYLKDLITEFQHGVNWLQSITQESATAIAMLKDQAMGLAQITPFSPLEIIQGQGALALAGFKTESILKMTPAVLDLAAAGKIGLEGASKLLTSVILGYEMSADEISSVADNLAYIASNANTTVAELGPSFRYILTIAKSIDVPLERLSAMLGVLRNAGQVAGTASRALRALYVGLAAPTGPAKKAMQSLGFDPEKLRQGVLQGEDIDILQAFSNLGKEADIGKLKVIFGRRHAAPIISLISNVPKIQQLESELYGARGAASEKAGILMSGLPGSVKRMESAVDNLIQVTGESGLIAVLTNFTETVRGVSNSISNMPSILKTFFVSLFSIFTPIIGIAGLLKFSKYAMGGLFGKDFFSKEGKAPVGFSTSDSKKGSIKEALSKIAIPIPTKRMEKVSALLKRSGAAIATVFKTIGVGKISLIIAAVAALGSAVWAVAQNWDKVTSMFKKFTDSVRQGLGPIIKITDIINRWGWSRKEKDLYERVAEETGDPISAHKAIIRYMRYHRRGIREDIRQDPEYQELPEEAKGSYRRKEIRRRMNILVSRSVESDEIDPSLQARIKEIKKGDTWGYSLLKDERKAQWKHERYLSMNTQDVIKENRIRLSDQQKKVEEEKELANELAFIKNREQHAKDFAASLKSKVPGSGTLMTKPEPELEEFKPELSGKTKPKKRVRSGTLMTKPEPELEEFKPELSGKTKPKKRVRSGTLMTKPEPELEEFKPELSGKTKPKKRVRSGTLMTKPEPELEEFKPELSGKTKPKKRVRSILIGRTEPELKGTKPTLGDSKIEEKKLTLLEIQSKFKKAQIPDESNAENINMNNYNIFKGIRGTQVPEDKYNVDSKDMNDINDMNVLKSMKATRDIRSKNSTDPIGSLSIPTGVKQNNLLNKYALGDKEVEKNPAPAHVFQSTYADMMAAAAAMQGQQVNHITKNYTVGDVNVPITASGVNAEEVAEIAGDTVKRHITEAVRSFDTDEGL